MFHVYLPSIFNAFSTTQNSHIPKQSSLIVEDAKRQNLNFYSLMAKRGVFYVMLLSLHMLPTKRLQVFSQIPQHFQLILLLHCLQNFQANPKYLQTLIDDQMVIYYFTRETRTASPVNQPFFSNSILNFALIFYVMTDLSQLSIMKKKIYQKSIFSLEHQIRQERATVE